jgi:hypothetical protein
MTDKTIITTERIRELAEALESAAEFALGDVRGFVR